MEADTNRKIVKWQQSVKVIKEFKPKRACDCGFNYQCHNFDKNRIH